MSRLANTLGRESFTLGRRRRLPVGLDVGDGIAAGDWRALRFFGFYRVTLAGLLLTLAVSEVLPRPLAYVEPRLFGLVAVAYLAVAIASSFAIQLRRPDFDAQVLLHVCTDIVAVTLFVHASGGVTSGMGMLLVFTVAGGSILSQGRIAILFAALASVAILTQQIVRWNAAPTDIVSYTHAGILGAAFFATALLVHASARRIRASEALVAEREVDLANLAALNEHIIQRMQSGILVVDENERILLSNASAQALLGLDPASTGGQLERLQPALHERYSRWRDDSYRPTYSFSSAGSQLEVTASFAALGTLGDAGAIVFLEDASAVTQRAQSLKLASLGRLTASIAHEIRNPLGAISHAGQLLTESERLAGADRRLTQIIQDNCRRVNGIIEDVQQLSRRQPSVRRNVDLRPWLEALVRERRTRGDKAGLVLTFAVDPPDLAAPFDPEQLRQVVSNLVENGIRHSHPDGVVELRAGMGAESKRPYLDVIDEGEGIAAENAENVFEPFFTTRPDGTGLGLYIARELCEANQASLRLLGGVRGCRFRVTFADPRRQGGIVQ